MGFSWRVLHFQKQKGNMNIFTKQKPLMNSPALCWFSNCLYSQVRFRQVPDDSFWRRRNALKTRLTFVHIYTMYHTCTTLLSNKCKLLYTRNVMVVYYTYYVHWIWYSTWSQPRKSFRLRFSRCDIFLSICISCLQLII